MDMGSGEIRVMTVHSAKGLEANVVILPDTCDKGEGRQKPKIYFHEGLPLWRAAGCADAPLLEALERAADQAREEEYARLLYVAMTRASDRLYIGGAINQKTVPQGTWYEKIDASLKPLVQATVDFSGRPVWQLTNAQEKTVPPQKAASLAEPTRLAPPAWALVEPKAERARLWLQPSKIGATEEVASPPQTQGSTNRFKRGTIIHTLLQYLPELEAGSREQACQRYLARKGLGLEPKEAEDITREVMRLLTLPEFAEVFGPLSQAEVPLAAFINEGQGLAGRIDRIAVTPEEVLILDYKTNRPPPERPEDVPAQYHAQMQAYRQALEPLFPGRRIRTALIWTDAARFMELMPHALT
jgi:ATP-dependent helicase/nuclease subunit A